MTYLFAFLFPGIICLIAEIILDNTKLTAGHITSIFSVMGSILAFLKFYPNRIYSQILIINFGNSLYLSGMEGYFQNGILGILMNLLSKSSFIISSTVIVSFILSLFFNPKD